MVDVALCGHLNHFRHFHGVSYYNINHHRSIEQITAQTMTIELYDENRGEKIPVETKIWNETIANLTLMALGSSAPEILLNLILTA